MGRPLGDAEMRDLFCLLLAFLLGALVVVLYTDSSGFREIYLGRMCHLGTIKACEINLEYRLSED